MLRIRAIPVCLGAEGDRTFWNNHGGKGKRRISSSWKQGRKCSGRREWPQCPRLWSVLGNDVSV